MRSRPNAILGIAVFVLAAFNVGGAHAQSADKTLNVASLGGKIDETFRKAMVGFEEKFGVRIRWMPGNSTENVAKAVATRDSPEFDVVLSDDIGVVALSKARVAARLDPTIVTAYADLRPQARFPGGDGVAAGLAVVGLFYNEAEFKKRGWAVPTSWEDLFRPAFCNHVGIMHPDIAYTNRLMIVLADGVVAKIPGVIARLAQLKDCVATLEPTAAKMEEKIQLGEYLVGVNGSIRVLPLSVAGHPVRFVVPSGGTSTSSTTVTVIAGSKERLAQEFVNWVLAPSAQRILLEDAFYLPANARVTVPQNLLDLGMPADSVLDRVVPLDIEAIMQQRRSWTRQFERAFAH